MHALNYVYIYIIFSHQLCKLDGISIGRWNGHHQFQQT